MNANTSMRKAFPLSQYPFFAIGACKLLIYVLCGLLPFVMASHAQQKTKGLFEASIGVRSQNKPERQYAAQRGLQEVFVRMSGTNKVLQDPKIQAAVDKAQTYMAQFQYYVNSNREEFEQGKRQVINIVFSESAVERTLRQSGQPYWPANRPKTLVWLVEDLPEKGRQFVNRARSKRLIESIEAAAAKRGLPLVYPLYDLEDRIAVSEDKLWSLDEEAIRQASLRYKADAVIVGRISETSRGRYLAYWEFFHNQTRKAFDSRTENMDEIARNAFNPVADYFASRYAIVPEQNESPLLVVQVSGVNNFAAYRKTLSYFEAMASISDVELAAARRDTLLIYLQSDSSLKFFENTLRLDNKLISEAENVNINTPEWQQVPRGTMTNPLQYRWSG